VKEAKKRDENATNDTRVISSKTRPRGTPITKVPKSNYETIYDRYTEGEAEEQIAADYKVTRQAINKIIKKTEGEVA